MSLFLEQLRRRPQRVRRGITVSVTALIFIVVISLWIIVGRGDETAVTAGDTDSVFNVPAVFDGLRSTLDDARAGVSGAIESAKEQIGGGADLSTTTFATSTAR